MYFLYVYFQRNNLTYSRNLDVLLKASVQIDFHSISCINIFIKDSNKYKLEFRLNSDLAFLQVRAYLTFLLKGFRFKVADR